MTEWYLVWILTLQSLSGVVTDQNLAKRTSSETDCTQRAELKIVELTPQLGDPYYSKRYSRGNVLGGVVEKVENGGTLIGFAVGCEERIKKQRTKWFYLDTKKPRPTTPLMVPPTGEKRSPKI